MKFSSGKRYLISIIVTGLLVLLAAMIIQTVITIRSKPQISNSAKIRQIAQSCPIYSVDNGDLLPEATDVWDFARQLAEAGGLESASLWISKQDPASGDISDAPKTVLLPGNTHPRQLDPQFRQLKPWIAVPLGKLTNSMPATTPVAWTRGLLPDGTWAKHSPYGDEGGYIAFIGGNVAYYKDLKADGGQLVRFDGQGQTGNILEALPPGCRIGEYVPTAAEQSAWSKR